LGTNNPTPPAASCCCMLLRCITPGNGRQLAGDLLTAENMSACGTPQLA
jgi:hypothetical protein